VRRRIAGVLDVVKCVRFLSCLVGSLGKFSSFSILGMARVLQPSRFVGLRGQLRMGLFF